MAARGWEGDDEDAPFTAARRGDGSVASGDRDNEQRGGGAEGDDAPGNESTDKQPPKTTKRKRNLLGESHLLSQEGFKKIYQTFPYQTSGGVAGQEAKALNSLIKMYKQWAYDLYPSLNFEDFVDRVETLGKTHSVQGLMSDLRSKETRRALGIPEDNDLPADNEANGERDQDADADPEESGFIVPGGDQDDGDDDDYSEEEAML